MQYKIILKVFGLLLIVFSFTMLPPVIISFIYHEHIIRPFLETFESVLLVGLLLWLPVRHVHDEMGTRDGFIIVALFWILFCGLGAVPFMLAPHPHMSFTNAFFEATSGFTTTGATVLTRLDFLPKSILFYRQQLQWFGGMGIIVLAVAILPVLGVGGMQLFRAETPGPIKDSKLVPRITETAKALYWIYIFMTVSCALCYWLGGMTVFDAITHSLSTVSTGGFSTHDASFGYFKSPLLEMISIIFMMLCGINFAVHYKVFRNRNIKAYWMDDEVRIYFLILLATGTLTSVYLSWHDNYHAISTHLHSGFFQVVSFMTTSGFTTTDFYNWPSFVPVLLIFVGFIGGCAGSTAGGMKVIRVLLLYRQGTREVTRLIHPNAQLPVMLGKSPVPENVIQAVWGYFGLYIVSFVALMLAMMATGVDQVTAFSTVGTCINNVGPGLGRVSANFAEMSDTVKWLAAFAMILGRLEIYTVLVLLSPTFWRY